MFLESDCGRAMIDLCSKMYFALLVFRYVARLVQMHLVYQENPSFLLSEPGERRGELTPSSFARIARIRSALAHEGWLAPPTVRPASRFPLRSGSEMPTRRQVLESGEFMADAVGIPDAEYVRGLSRRGGARTASIRAALNSVDKLS